jgi:hypothetical protein
MSQKEGLLAAIAGGIIQTVCTINSRSKEIVDYIAVHVFKHLH